MKYHPRLDGLRFIAISCVLIQHFLTVQIKQLPFGFYGVDLFLVISGFLITSILISGNKEFKISYPRFLFRRTLRIFPIYYLSLIILWTLNYQGVRENIFYLATYTYNYALVYYNLPLDGIVHFWSLSLEEQFYLFWPFIAIPLRHNKKALLFITVAIIFFGYGQILFGFISQLRHYNSVGLVSRMSSLGMGALIAICRNNKLIPDLLLKSKVLEYVAMIILILSFAFAFKFNIVLMGVCSAFLVIKSTAHFNFKPLDRLLTNRYAIRIGSLSYGIYLYHFPIYYYFHKYVFSPLWTKINFSTLGVFSKIKWHPYIFEVPLAVLLCILIAQLSFRYIESPLLKWRDRAFKSPVMAAPVITQTN